MKIKTSELIGPALDWAVAKCEGYEYPPKYLFSSEVSYHPSTDREQGVAIIERVGIDLQCVNGINKRLWFAMFDTVNKTGETLLIAAMRCYVASKLGDEVEIPEELL